MATQGCPCGFLGDAQHDCACGLPQVQRYRARVSGPLLDRIDIQIEVPAVRYKDLADRAAGEPSQAIRSRVDGARHIQLQRFAGRAIFCNAQMTRRDLRRHCTLQTDADQLLETAMNKLSLSARAYTCILKVARTIADLERSEGITATHISAAIQYRSLDRQPWG